MRTPEQAIAWCRGLSVTSVVYGKGKCLSFVEDAYTALHQGATAAAEWTVCVERGTGSIPYGAFVWWTGGQHGAGHVVVAEDAGWCYSTDFGSTGYIGDGRVRRVPVSKISASDPLLRYAGWSSDIGGQSVPLSQADITAVANATVDLLMVKHQNDATHPNTNVSIRSDTMAIRKKLGA